MRLDQRLASLRHEARRSLNRIGLDVRRHREYDPDLTREEIALWELVRPYTQLDVLKVLTFADAVRHVVDQDVPGAVLECGVGPGGSMMTAARTLALLGVDDRDLYLLDTFAGWPEPTERDRAIVGEEHIARRTKAYANPDHPLHVPPSVEQVRANMALAGYRDDRIHTVVGPVEETVPVQAPERIAVLRLDTDWYEATRHELEHLYPRLVEGGVLIVDDYSNWAHQRQAVDEYFAGRPRPLLVRVGYGSRVAVKR